MREDQRREEIEENELDINIDDYPTGLRARNNRSRRVRIYPYKREE